MIKEIRHTKIFKTDIEKYKNNSVQMKELANILKEMVETQSHSFLGISSKNRKEYHMDSGLLFLYRIDDDILYLERFGSHNELFNK